MSSALHLPHNDPGFVGLRTPLGFLMVMFGLILVGLIVVAGGVISRYIENENVERRRQLKKELEARKQPFE